MSEQTIGQAKLILVVDDEKAVVQALAKRCEQLGIKVYKAHDAIEAMAMINHHDATLDLMLLDYHMPGADGLTLCDMVKTNEAYSSIPVILLTGHDNEETRRRCQAAGAHFVRKNVNAWEKLEPLIRRLLGLGNAPGPMVPAAKSRSKEESAAQQRTTAAKNVLIIDDDPMIAKGLRIRLEALGYRAHGALNGMDGYIAATKIHPDLIILDYKMPQGWGNTVLGKLKSNGVTRDIPVIILSGMTDVGVQRDILRLGAERWINKPFEMKNLIKIVKDRIGLP